LFDPQAAFLGQEMARARRRFKTAAAVHRAGRSGNRPDIIPSAPQYISAAGQKC
jgi:hypothetical protein